jgi:hypothetical protein
LAMWPHLFSFVALRYSNALPIGINFKNVYRFV